MNEIKVFRAGEQGRYWYAVLGGQLEVRYHAAADSDTKVSVHISNFFSLFKRTTNIDNDTELGKQEKHEAK